MHENIIAHFEELQNFTGTHIFNSLIKIKGMIKIKGIFNKLKKLTLK